MLYFTLTQNKPREESSEEKMQSVLVLILEDLLKTGWSLASLFAQAGFDLLGSSDLGNWDSRACPATILGLEK